MVVKNEFEQNEIQKLLKAANIGWWKADFKQEVYICSDFLQDLLGLKSDILPFWDFYNLIRDDYKNRISSEFATIKNQEVYEQTFPILSRYGEKWIHSKMYHKEKTENGQIIAYGFIQCIDNPENQHSTVQQINELLYRQHSISPFSSFFYANKRYRKSDPENIGGHFDTISRKPGVYFSIQQGRDKSEMHLRSRCT